MTSCRQHCGWLQLYILAHPEELGGILLAVLRICSWWYSGSHWMPGTELGSLNCSFNFCCIISLALSFVLLSCCSKFQILLHFRVESIWRLMSLAHCTNEKNIGQETFLSKYAKIPQSSYYTPTVFWRIVDAALCSVFVLKNNSDHTNNLLTLPQTHATVCPKPRCIYVILHFLLLSPLSGIPYTYLAQNSNID